MVRKTLALIKGATRKDREIIDSLLKQIPWSARQQEYAITLIFRYLPTINRYDLKHEKVKEEFVLDQSDHTKKQVVEVNKIKNGNVPQQNVPLSATLFNHQKTAHAIGTTLDSAALLMEMGTGKTLSAISIAGKRFLDKQITRLLIVAPVSVMHVWEDQFEQYARFDYVLTNASDVRSIDLNSHVDITRIKSEKILDVLIVSYETAWRMADQIFKWLPDMVIADESQKIKNADSKRSEFLHELGIRVKYKLILSGTPITHSPLDVFSQYKFLNSSIFGDNYWKFRNTYAIMGGYNDKQVIGFKNVEKLTEKAHSIAYRVTKDEVLDLPEYVDEVIYCDLQESKESYKQQEKEIKDLISAGKCGTTQALSMIGKMSQITGGFLINKDEDEPKIIVIGSEKMRMLKSVIDDIPRDKKFVVFCRFRAEVAAIVDLLNEMNITNYPITGDTSQEVRADINRKFQNDDDPKVVVMTSQVGGLGIDLFRADTMIFYSQTYSYGDYEQARARIHRQGQKNKCTYIHLLMRGTIDEKVQKVLNKKGDFAKMVVDRINRGDVVWK